MYPAEVPRSGVLEPVTDGPAATPWRTWTTAKEPPTRHGTGRLFAVPGT